MFLFLSLLFFLWDGRAKWIEKNSLFYLGLAIFGFYFLSIIINYFYGAELALEKGFSRGSELKDLFLFSAFIVVQGLDSEEEKKVLRSFWILIAILVVTGFASVFSIVRLSVLLKELFAPVTTWRLAHHYGNIGGLGIYLPIGLMNTHLTFGGLLLLLYPFVFFRFLGSFRMRGNTKQRLLLGASLGVFTFVFLLNNARSAMLGAGLAILFGFYDYVFCKKAISPARFSKAVGILAVILVLSLSVLWNISATQRTLKHLLGDEKHTDSGRTFIWNSSFPLMENNFWSGIGPGRYNLEIEKSRKALSIQNTELMYFYEVTQRGHSHNDFFHLLTISGIGALLSYLCLLYGIVHFINRKVQSISWSPLFYGLVGFFLAGTLQCYFQDDEVVIVFWYLVGLLSYKGESLGLLDND
jgi:O-antigen ligase